MQGVVIIGKPEQWQRVKARPGLPNARAYDAGENRYVVELEEGYVAFNRDDTLAREYGEGELNGVPFFDRTYLLVEYSSAALLRQIILQGVFDDEAWIDDDNHPLVTVRDFLKRLVTQPSWDWRV